MHPLTRFACSVAALAGLLPGLARADVTVTTRLDNFRITVIDLRPDDGIAAGYSYRQATLDMVTSISGYSSQVIYSPQMLDMPVSYRYDNGVVESIRSDAVNQIELLSKGGLATLPQYSHAYANGQFTSVLRLVPRTRLKIEVDYHGSLDIRPDAGFYFATSFAELIIPGGFDRGVISDYQNGFTERTDTLSIVLENGSNVAVDRTFTLYSYASASYISPVPELPSYAMTGLGALLLGALRRRRQRGPDAT